MELLKAWANKLMNSKAVIFGIAHYDPKTTPTEKCLYDI
jgi:DNA gyrase inhibitor GyrI